MKEDLKEGHRNRPTPARSGGSERNQFSPAVHTHVFVRTADAPPVQTLLTGAWQGPSNPGEGQPVSYKRNI